MGTARLRQSRRRRDPAARLLGGDARRHRMEPARRIPLLRHHDHRGRRELEDDRRRVQRDLSHPDAAPGAPQVHGRCVCPASHLGSHRQVRTALRSAQSEHQGRADRRRGVGRLRGHSGRADGRRGGHSVPGDQRRARPVGGRRNRGANKSVRRRARRRPELGDHRPGDAAAPVQRVPEHVAADQRRPLDGADFASGARPRSRRTGDDRVDADATRRAAQPSRRTSG